MSAIATGALGVKAWYQVAATGNASKNTGAALTAAVAKPDVSSGLAWELSVAIKYVGSYTSAETDPTDQDTMEMMTIKAAADAATGAAVGINFGYYTTSGTNNVHYVQNQFGTNIDYWRVYKFTASIPASQTVGSVTYTQDEVFQGMGGSSTKFKMTGSVDTSTSRAKLYQGAADKAAPTAGQTTDLVFASDLTFSAKDSSIVGYLGVYIEGDGTNDGTNTAPSGAFSVSIAKQTA